MIPASLSLALNIESLLVLALSFYFALVFSSYMLSQYICVGTKFLFFFVLVFAFQAEKIASRMIYEDRMRGSIDQV